MRNPKPRYGANISTMTSRLSPLCTLLKWKPTALGFRAARPQRRCMSLIELARSVLATPVLPRSDRHQMKKIKICPPPPSARAKCKDPVAAVQQAQISVLDPTGARTRLFDKLNTDGAKVGDILLVRQRNGDPFAGVCIDIRRRGVDTAIFLRGNLTRVGVEMWYKIYSPNVTGIEVVKRKEKRARRARLYYLRQPKHDIGSVEGIVRHYERRRRMLGSIGSGEQEDAGGSTKKKKGKK